MAGILFRSFVLAGSRRFSTSVQAPLVWRTLRGGDQLPKTQLGWPHRGVVGLREDRRWFCSSSGEESGGEEGGNKNDEKEEEEESEKEEEEVGGGGLGLEMLPIPRHHAIAPVSIPEVFPEVPVLPISRNPVFPRFVKMLEVSLVAWQARCLLLPFTWVELEYLGWP
jgi:Lon-like ATP-dependent protease